MTFGKYLTIGAICFAVGVFAGLYARSPKEGYTEKFRNHNLFVVRANNGWRTSLIEQNDGYFVRLSEFNKTNEKEEKLEKLEKTIIRFDKARFTR